MKKPMQPPEMADPATLAKQLGPEVFGRILTEAMSIPDAYLHWDQLQHREPPAGLDLESWWYSLKLGRLRGARSLPLHDCAGRAFFYTLPNQALAQLHAIDSQARGQIRLDEQVTGPETRDRYIVSSLMEEAITSSQLEGASTTRKVAVEMLRTGRKPRDQSERMIFNNYAAMQYIRTLKGADLAPEVVLELHRIVTLDTLEDPAAAGRLQRPDEKRVRVWVDRDGTVLHTPPPATQLPDRLQALCEFANRKFNQEDFIPPVIHAIVLHFWLAYDHPFEDGNGRTARALFYWSMLRHGYWLIEYVSISRLLRRAPSQYSRAFLYTETDDNDLTYFILHQLGIIQQAISDLEHWLEHKMSELRTLERRLRTDTELNHRQRALLAHALQHHDATYTIQSHRRSHDVAYATARSDLLSLTKQGLLEQYKAGRAMR
ncbi:MAG TPA: Fic family protein, partial [Gammaproteobacteria bacterium]|nr:Fic family protein [Gammaproteobacteria bacterium]